MAQMPTSEQLYSYLYDEGEQRSTEYYGTRKKSPELVDTVEELLRVSFKHKLELVVKKTQQSLLPGEMRSTVPRAREREREKERGMEISA